MDRDLEFDQLNMTKTVRRKATKREIRHLVAGETCYRAIGEIYHGMEVFGLTNGQFSTLNLIEELLKQTGPATVDISTWTAANVEIKGLELFLANESVSRLRFLVDRSFPNRQPKYYQAMLNAFGEKGMRIARTHCKFVTIVNDKWHLAIRTSMNLNENRRTENFEISDSQALTDYLTSIVDYYFEKPFSRKGDIIKAQEFASDDGETDEFDAVFDELEQFNWDAVFDDW